MLIPILLSGGSGSRLWPVSRQLYPKQFLKLTNPHTTMLQDTLQRLKGLKHDDAIVICNEEHRFLAAEQLRQLGVRATLILEPAARNTAPATALAALRANSLSDDPLLLVLPADHAIDDIPAFHNALAEGQRAAENGALVTFGVTPTYAESGYGYIQSGAARSDAGLEILDFLEKPDPEAAEHFLNSGGYMWNSGIFMFLASRYLEELELFAPDIVEACRKSLGDVESDMDFLRVDPEAFLQSPSESIDCAVMEKTAHGAVIPLDASWSDVGSWSALMAVGNKGEEGNIIQGDVITEDTQNCLVRSESRLVATCGVEGLVVVETKDAVLVADGNDTESVKSLVETLETEQRPESHSHREVYRPWGMYDSVDSGDRYRVKRISVEPGGKLSVQMHHHRAEHWVVVRGTARVRRGNSTFLVAENESTFIPIGETHSLENPGVIPLEVIEVQSGAYLGEDDIVRLEDKYGRATEL